MDLLKQILLKQIQNRIKNMILRQNPEIWYLLRYLLHTKILKQLRLLKHLLKQLDLLEQLLKNTAGL